MTEREWWARYVKDALNDPTKRWLAEKVEDRFKPGLPDLDVMCEGFACKIEMKFAKKKPKRDASSYPAGLSPEQRLWLRRYAHCGGYGYVLVGFEESRSFHFFAFEAFVAIEQFKDASGLILLDLPWSDLPEVMKYLSSVSGE